MIIEPSITTVSDLITNKDKYNELWWPDTWAFPVETYYLVYCVINSMRFTHCEVTVEGEETTKINAPRLLYRWLEYFLSERLRFRVVFCNYKKNVGTLTWSTT